MDAARDRVALGSQPTRSVKFASEDDSSMDDDDSDVTTEGMQTDVVK